MRVALAMIEVTRLQRDRGGRHAIRAAYAFDGTQFLVGGTTVIVEGDRIAGVEPGRVELPDHIEVAECAGTVLPGLIDCHTHLVADATRGGLERAGAMSEEEVDSVIAASLRAHAAAGVTTVRDLGDRGYRTLAFRGRSDLPRVVASGPPLTTPGGHCNFLGGAVPGEQLAAAVAEHAATRADPRARDPPPIGEVGSHHSGRGIRPGQRADPTTAC